jgi:hypothetical protein
MLHESVWLLVAPAIAAAVALVGHVAVLRWRPALGLYKAMVLGAGAGLLVLATLIAWAGIETPDMAARALASALIYFCFCYVVFHFNNMGETARRIRLLRELVAAGRPLAFEEIVERYGANEIVQRRLDRLVGAGQVRAMDGRYVIADRSVYRMALIMNIAHRILFGRSRRQAGDGNPRPDIHR